MIIFFSNWVKGIGVTIVVVSIIEMLLPNNKTKKYIQMLLGIFVIFNIVAPLVQNTDKFSLSDISLEKYKTQEVSSTMDETNINNTITKLYEEELQNDIKNKLQEKGYEVIKCKVSSRVIKEEYEITKISLEVDKQEKIEEKLVTQIEKIKKIDTSIKQEIEEKSLSEADSKELKKFLSEEYGVNEKCLEIN